MSSTLRDAVEDEHKRKERERGGEVRSVWFRSDVHDFYAKRAKSEGVAFNGLINAVLRRAMEDEG